MQIGRAHHCWLPIVMKNEYYIIMGTKTEKNNYHDVGFFTLAIIN